MKKIIAYALCVIMCGMLLVGCGIGGKEKETTAEIVNDAAVYGVWTEAAFDSGFTFYADGTGLDIFWDLPFKYTAVDGIITVTYDDNTYGVCKYAYTVDDSSITMTRKSDDGVQVTYKKTGSVPAAEVPAE